MRNWVLGRQRGRPSDMGGRPCQASAPPPSAAVLHHSAACQARGHATQHGVGGGKETDEEAAAESP